MHSLAARRPVADENVPGGHGYCDGDDVPNGQYEPAAQGALEHTHTHNNIPNPRTVHNQTTTTRRNRGIDNSSQVTACVCVGLTGSRDNIGEMMTQRSYPRYVDEPERQ